MLISSEALFNKPILIVLYYSYSIWAAVSHVTSRGHFLKCVTHNPKSQAIMESIPWVLIGHFVPTSLEQMSLLNPVQNIPYSVYKGVLSCSRPLTVQQHPEGVSFNQSAWPVCMAAELAP